MAESLTARSRIMQQVTDGLRPLSFDPEGSKTAILESAATGWRGLPFEVHRTVPGELTGAGPARGELGLLVFLEGAVDLASTTAGRDTRYRAVPGTTVFMSGDQPACVRAVGSSVVAAVPVLPEWFQRVELEHDPNAFERLAPRVADANMLSLVSTMRREAHANGATGRLYADALSTALIAYVLDRIPTPHMRVHGGLTDAQRRRLSQHIRERLGDDLALAELAALVGVSTRHFSRVFREAYGITPHQYVLKQRIEEAARRLTCGTPELAELALSLGFSSQSHFATAFRKRFAQTPRQFAIRNRRRSHGY